MVAHSIDRSCYAGSDIYFEPTLGIRLTNYLILRRRK
jgi:hypothetical protein